MVLLIGAALLIKSLARVYRVDPGFQTSHLLTMNIALPAARYDTDEKKAKFYRELVEHAESLPGVRSAAVTRNLPMTDTWVGQPVQLAGIPPLRLNERPIAVTQNISPEYFRTLAITLKRGRKFTAQDNATSVPVAIVNENLARLFWPQYPGNANPVGLHILIGNDPQPVEVVGIAPNVRQSGRDANPRPEVYLPCPQKPPQSPMLPLRTDGSPLSSASAVRAQVLAIDRDQPVSAIASMDELVEASEGQLRLMMTLLGTFAG